MTSQSKYRTEILERGDDADAGRYFVLSMPDMSALIGQPEPRNARRWLACTCYDWLYGRANRDKQDDRERSCKHTRAFMERSDAEERLQLASEERASASA